MKACSAALLLLSLLTAGCTSVFLHGERGLCVAFGGEGGLRLAVGGATDYVILTDPAATAPEKFAAAELAKTLRQITGAEFPVREAGAEIPPQAILVGPGAAARRHFGSVPFDQLGGEELVVRTRGARLLLAGGRPRGTVYAVNRFLQTAAGVRWWAPWASRIPTHADLRIGPQNRREQPAFEQRDPYWTPAFDPLWAVHNFSNAQSADIPADMGGAVRYAGFVHTFYPLVPPKAHFAEHPEWYSLRKGKRTTDQAQLCLSNPGLRDFVVERVKARLRAAPAATIVSVSQNDWHGCCQCDACKALDEAEGSPSGSLLAFVNYIAEKIEPEFPQVAVDTLAYQYTRKPPKTIQARPNVIVRLCSIECNFREPLDHASNAAFAADILGWEQSCQRLYVWNYVTDFAHYEQPHPNWFELGPNLRFFQQHHVKGLFDEGAYQSQGSEMAELRAWVTAQLMWDPQQDDRALIREFLDGYYGAAGAPIARYLEVLHQASAGYRLTCYSPSSAPFLQFATLAPAEALWREAAAAVEGDPELSRRVRVGRLPLGYVWLARWKTLREECAKSGDAWPLPESRRAFAQQWLDACSGEPAAPWTKVTQLNEPGLTPEAFVKPMLEAAE